MPYGTLNADKVVNSDSITSGGLYGFKNRLINGDMRIDQRNAGASVTPASGAYTVDRWVYFASQASKFTAQQSSVAPAGFTRSLLFTTASAVSVGSSDFFQFQQPIEGFNTADLGWGTANAQSVTLSFWVRSSLTGTFGGALKDASSRSYPFSYIINSANTWEQKTVTIAGDTSGTWATDNSASIRVAFGLGNGSTFSSTAGSWQAGNFSSATGATSVVGTNGATFYITGVQLEKGSTATSFDYRPYGTELALCQRYFTNSWSGSGKWYTTTTCAIYGRFPVTMRVAPTTVAVAASPGNIEEPGVSNRAVSAVASSNLTADGGVVNFTTATATLNAVGGAGGSANSIATFSAEL